MNRKRPLPSPTSVLRPILARAPSASSSTGAVVAPSPLPLPSPLSLPSPLPVGVGSPVGLGSPVGVVGSPVGVVGSLPVGSPVNTYDPNVYIRFDLEQTYKRRLCRESDLQPSPVLTILEHMTTRHLESQTHGWFTGKHGGKFKARDMTHINTLYKGIVDQLASDNDNLFLNELVYKDGNGELRLFFEIDMTLDITRVNEQTQTVYYAPIFAQMTRTVRQYLSVVEPGDLFAIVMKRSHISFKRPGSDPSFGFHVVYPNIVLTFDQVKQIASHVNVDVMSMDPRVHVDTNVLKQNNATLRTVYSYKYFSCPYGKCDICLDERVVERSFYSSDATLDENGALCPVPFDLKSYDELALTSIRNTLMAPHDSPHGRRAKLSPFKMPENVPSFVEAPGKHAWRGKNERGVTSRGALVDSDVVRGEVKKYLERLDPAYQIDNLKTIEVRKRSNGDHIVSLHATGRSYCLYERRSHRSNRVYFVFGKNSVVKFHCFDENCSQLEGIVLYQEWMRLKSLLWPTSKCGGGDNELPNPNKKSKV